MRVYYLHINRATVTTDDTGNIWTTGLIDLYANDSYQNFTVHKSRYGTDALLNGTWTGIRTNTDEVGYLSGGSRFVDLTGEIDLVSYNLEKVQFSAEGTATATLDVYTAPTNTAQFPDDFTQHLGFTTSDTLELFSSYRFAQFVITWTPSTEGLTVSDADLFLRVEVGPPDEAPFYARTRAVLDKFPSWMAIRELDNEDPGPTDTPQSLGGRFVNAAAGEWLDELYSNLSYLDLQRFIDTVDLDQMCWAYRTSQIPQAVYSIQGDGVELTRAFDLVEFKEALPDEDVAYWDESRQDLYTNKTYGSLTINGQQRIQAPWHVWNWVDELGLFVDLGRIWLEENESFQLRIKDVYINRSGVGVDNFKKALRRELNLWRIYGSPPDSNFAGATPEILEVSDIERDAVYVQPDGMPTEKFIGLVATLADLYPTTWGRFHWGEAIWDVGGLKHEGYSVLPYRLDGNPLPSPQTQSGVGDGNDLLVYRPGPPIGVRDFNAQVKIRGRVRSVRTINPKVDFLVNVYGQADRVTYVNPTITIPLTVELVSATDTWTYSFDLPATSDVDVDQSQPLTQSVLDIFHENGFTQPTITWVNKVTGIAFSRQQATPVGPDNAFLFSETSSLALRHGHWDVAQQQYVDLLSQDVFTAWFSHDPTTVLKFNSGVWPLTTSAHPQVVATSSVTNSSLQKWYSEPITYPISVNGQGPDQLSAEFSLPVPDIQWDTFLANPPNKEIVVELGTSTSSLYGAYTADGAGESAFIDSSTLQVNQLNNWVTGHNGAPVQVFDAAGTSFLDFSTGYSVDSGVWTVFEAENLPMAGRVDEDGPWRGGTRPNAGNTDYALTLLSPRRSEFSIPNTPDYVVTWMSVEADDPDVIVWLDSNTVQPYNDINPGLTYPDNAIVESALGADSMFGPLVLRARLRPDPLPNWQPQINAGYFYDRQKEFYFYTNPVEELIPVADATPVLLAEYARQGAPIIVKTDTDPVVELRQVWFPSEVPPVQLSLVNKQVVPGNGTDTLFLAYTKVFNVSVLNASSGAMLNVLTTHDNQVVVDQVTNKTDTYEVRYMLQGSFTADNEYIDPTTRRPRTLLAFDRPATQWGGTSYKVIYETALYSPATPVDLDLSPLYSTVNEGFIFISHNEYTLDSIHVKVNPSKLVADGLDYLLISIRSLDRFGNTKPNQSFDVATSWGFLDNTHVVTDKDGFAVVTLTADTHTTSLTGRITITGGVNASLSFDIATGVTSSTPYQLFAIAGTDAVPADTVSQNIVYGRIEGPEQVPAAAAFIRWVRGRSLHDLFTFVASLGGSVATMGAGTMGLGTMGGSSSQQDAGTHDFGTVIADQEGIFTIGPFTSLDTSQSGYWMLGMESTAASPPIYGLHWAKTGDLVSWYEYPDTLTGVEDLSGLPRRPYQHATPVDLAIPYARGAKYPTSYEEGYPDPPATPSSINWLPSQWFALNMYDQYQLGLLGSTPNALDINRIPSLHPAQKDI